MSLTLVMMCSLSMAAGAPGEPSAAPPDLAGAAAPNAAPTDAAASPDAGLAPSVPTAPAAAPRVDASTPPAIPVLGPFRIGTQGNSLELGYAVQLRASVYGATGADVTGNVEFRRLRLYMRGSLLDGRLAVLLQLSTAPSSLELVDAMVDWRITKSLGLRIGQFKTPFTALRQESFSGLPLADWSVFSYHFGAERQIGVMLHDGGGKDAHWVYQAGVFTGVNARASFAKGIASIYGETLTNPSDLHAFHGPTALHPAVIARVGHESAGVASKEESDAAGGPLRHAVNLSAAWDAQPRYAYDFPLRLAPEVLFKWNHVFLDVAAATGFYVDGAGAWGLASVGENVEAGWRFLPRWEVAARYSRVDVLQGARDDARARADALVAAAATPAEATALAARYAKVGTQRWTQELGAGLNFYFAGNGMKWQTDVVWTRTDEPLKNEVRVRTQLQLAF